MESRVPLLILVIDRMILTVAVNQVLNNLMLPILAGDMQRVVAFLVLSILDVSLR